MPAPLLPLLAGAISRLVTANVGRSVAGAIGRATASRGAAAAVQPGNARSAASSVFQSYRLRAARSAKRAKLQIAKRAPILAQRRQWGKVQQAFGQINKARNLRYRGVMQGNSAMIDRADEQEEAAKKKLAKATKDLLESFTGLKRGLIGLLIALHTIPFAVQAMARARVDSFRSTGMYAGQTAGALARYDVNERLNKISSARFTSGSDSRVVGATQSLNNEIKPLTDAMHVLYNEGLVVLIRATTGLVSAMKTFSPLVGAVDKLAKYFADKKTGKEDVTISMLQGFVLETQKQADRARADLEKNRLPAGFPGGQQ